VAAVADRNASAPAEAPGILNEPALTRERSGATRAAMVDDTRNSTSSSSRRAHRLLTAVLTGGAGLLVVGGGLTAASAAGLIDWPFTTDNPLPGGDTAVVIPAPTGGAASGGLVLDQVGTGPAALEFPAPPAGATHLSVRFTCLTAGQYTWGLDPGNNPGVTCSAADIAAGGAGYDFAIHNGLSTFYIDTDPNARWHVSAAFLAKAPTDWAVNENGDTYGVANDSGTPDLVAVITTEGHEGYAYADELAEADGTAAVKEFDSPEDALRWQQERRGKIFRVPVYESDGETVLGEFVIRG
jgi:hypothetical protein